MQLLREAPRNFYWPHFYRETARTIETIITVGDLMDALNLPQSQERLPSLDWVATLNRFSRSYLNADELYWVMSSLNFACPKKKKKKNLKANG